jgi:hypothetical protein
MNRAAWVTFGVLAVLTAVGVLGCSSSGCADAGCGPDYPTPGGSGAPGSGGSTTSGGAGSGGSAGQDARG